MTEETETQEKPSFTIEDITVEGAEGRLVKTLEGNPLFRLSTSFDDEQVAEVYAVCSHFFGQGRQEGIKALQAEHQRLMGIKVAPAEETPEDLIEE